MKTYLTSIIAVILTALIVSTFVLYKRNQVLRDDRDKYKGNTETLLDSVVTYKTKDSLNAATIGDLVLRQKEFARYRASDAELIKSLQVKNRDLQNVTTTQLKTINQLKGSFKDSIVYVPVINDKGNETGKYINDTIKCLKVDQKWFKLDGCIDKQNNFVGSFENYDSLLIATTVKYKRFLGFLWKTKKVKDRKVDVVSKNPNTKITGIEFIEIIK